MTKRDKNDTFFLVGERPGWTEHVLSFVLLDSIFCHGFCVGIVLRHVCGDQFKNFLGTFLLNQEKARWWSRANHDWIESGTLFFVAERI